MEFEIDQKRFLSALTMAATVADKRGGTLPILANVRLQVTDGELEVVSTDMTITITQAVRCKMYATGSLTIGVRHLLAVVRSLPAGTVRVKALDNSWAQITSARTEFKIMGLPVGDFPDLPDADGVDLTKINGSTLVGLIDRTAFSVSTDEARVNLNGALFDLGEGSATMVSTDGHRLTKTAADMDGTLDLAIIIPRKGLDSIRKVIDQVEIGDDIKIGVDSGTHHMFVDTIEFELAIKLNNVTFPPWIQVVPKDYQRRPEVDRDELIRALVQCEVIAPEKTSSVKVDLKSGALGLSSKSPELGNVELEIPADYSGTVLTAGFNATYILEALRVMSTDRVALEFQGELDPVVLRPVGDDAADFLAVVMPMRI